MGATPAYITENNYCIGGESENFDHDPPIEPDATKSAECNQGTIFTATVAGMIIAWIAFFV